METISIKLTFSYHFSPSSVHWLACCDEVRCLKPCRRIQKKFRSLSVTQNSLKITHFNSGVSMRTRLFSSTLYSRRWRSRCIPFIKRKVALTLLHVHYRKVLALVINLRRFLLALRYLLLRKQNYNVVHTLISPVDWRMFLSTCVVYRQVCQDVGLGKTQLNDYNLKELKEV